MALTITQLKTFRFYRNKGFSIGEARKLAKMNYHQLATELSKRLREQAHFPRTPLDPRPCRTLQEVKAGKP